ncbi:RasGAP protein [Coemansia sp. RSA 1722]|nr:RasGAP protein [Coemansia sp. RSA 485]KAJ2594282.1 RasGAP protein [Coemansia sp. RSA 1722]
MPVKREDTETIVEDDRINGSGNDNDNYESGSSSGGWLGRLLCGLRRIREGTASTNGSSNSGNGNGKSSSSSSKTRSKPSVAIVESGAVVIGPVKDSNVAIPAEIMFSTQRASLYSAMMTLLVHDPFYISRIVNRVKYHECDALLYIILDSVFGSPAYELSLTSLFTEIIESEVDRTTSIDTVMRNDEPSVHMLSAYLKKQCCLDYLQIAVGPTIETIVALGNTSLDPELASVYQDWARTQKTLRLPLVVSAVEAASYTEVQNLSRRRQRHLVHLATHCLYDIINARSHIPSGLLAICSSTLQATMKRFPHIDQAKAFSLVGGIFFLRFVNAALTSPNQYGLLETAPSGTMKSNLKLVARLMQRLSNNWGKPSEEWPLDARKFMKINAQRFHSFLVSLTTDAAGAELANSLLEKELEGMRDRYCSSMPRTSEEEDERKKKKKKERAKRRIEMGTRIHLSHTDQSWTLTSSKKHAKSSMNLFAEATSTKTASTAKEMISSILSRSPPSKTMASTEETSVDSNGKAQAMLHQSIATTTTTSGSSSGGGEGTSDTSGLSGNSSVQSMFDIADRARTTSQEPPQPLLQNNSSGASGPNDVVLPLNDLYLLQKYLSMYSDAWVGGEPVRAGVAKMAGLFESLDCDSAAPMKSCLEKLGTAPSLVPLASNHKTRIKIAPLMVPEVPLP